MLIYFGIYMKSRNFLFLLKYIISNALFVVFLLDFGITLVAKETFIRISIRLGGSVFLTLKQKETNY